MHRLGLIRPLTGTERQNLERLYKGCEAPGCAKQPECAITLDRPGPGDERITVYTPASTTPGPGTPVPKMRDKTLPIIQLKRFDGGGSGKYR